MVRILWLLAMMVSSSVMAHIQITLSETKPVFDEPFDIIFSTSQTGNYTPDLTPLNEHFKVLNQQFSQSSKYINGESSNEIQWIISVLAKKPGLNEIPAISFGNDASESLKFEVSDAPKQKKAKSVDEDGLFVKMEALPANTVKGGQTLLTVKLYSAYPLQNANITQIETNFKEDVLVIPLGGINPKTVVENNRTYEVFEQRYAVFASKVGTATIPPVQVNAEIIDINKQRTWFGMGTQTLQVTSAPVRLHVIEPKETGYSVVSHDFKITSNISGGPYEPNVPITLTLGLKGIGTPVNQLKAVVSTLESQLKERGLQYYMDAPDASQEVTKDGIKSTLVQKIAIIPQAQGPLEVPSFSIKWLNALSLTTQTITLKPYSMNVVAGQAGTAPTVVTTASSSEISSPPPNYWQWACALMGALWALSMLIHPLRKRWGARKKSSRPVDSQFNRALQKALKINSLSEIETLILQQSQQSGLSVRGMLDLIEYFGEFEDDIQEFHAARFNPQYPDYDPKPFIKRFIPVLQAYSYKPTSSKTTTKLPPLYPA